MTGIISEKRKKGKDNKASTEANEESKHTQTMNRSDRDGMVKVAGRAAGKRFSGPLV